MRAGVRAASKTVSTPAEAYALAQKMLATEASGFTVADAWAMLRAELEAASASPETERFYARRLNGLRKSFPDDTRLDKVTPERIRDHLTMRTTIGQRTGAPKPVSAETAAKELTLMRRLCRVALRNNALKIDPTAHVQRPRTRPRRFRHMALPEIRGHLGRVTEPDRALFEFVLYTALRRSEVARLRPADVDKDCWAIMVRGKTHDPRLPLTEPARAALLRLLALGRDPVFGSPARVGRRFAVWRDRLGEPRWSAHALRHSAATAMVRAGVPVEQVQAALRHSNIAQTLRYYHDDGGDARRAFGALGE